MRTIAPRLILRMTTTAKFEISLSLQNFAICINKINSSSKANRSTLWVDKNLWIISHGFNLTLNRGSREVIANEMGGEALT